VALRSLPCSLNRPVTWATLLPGRSACPPDDLKTSGAIAAQHCTARLFRRAGTITLKDPFSTARHKSLECFPKLVAPFLLTRHCGWRVRMELNYGKAMALRGLNDEIRVYLERLQTAISNHNSFYMSMLCHTNPTFRWPLLRESLYRGLETNGILHDATVLCQWEQARISSCRARVGSAISVATQNTTRTVYTYFNRLRHIISLESKSISILIGIARSATTGWYPLISRTE
jgi:hypothetical protein